MNITGKTTVIKGDYGYSCIISNKNQNREWDRMYLSIQLPKDVELENKTKIDITRGFFSFYKTKEGLAKPKIVVMEYNILQEQKNNDFQVDDTQLPF